MIRSEKQTPAKMLRRVLALVLALLIVGSVAVSAASVEEVPYYSYCYWEGPSRYEAIPMRAMYEPYVELSADTLGMDTALNVAEFIAMSQDNTEVFILDSGNSRIVVLDVATKEVNRIIGEVQSSDGALNYTGAKGLYVSKEGNLYIADFANQRVLITDGEGNLIRQLDRSGLTVEEGVPENMEYKPYRIIMDDKDYLFVACEACYYGILVYDTDLNFLGFHGSYAVQQSVVDTIKGWITGLFMTNEKSHNSLKTLPAEILDISIDSEGMLYTLSAGNAGQIKRLGLNGNQTLSYKFGFTSQSGDLISFKENPGMYWHAGKRYMVSLTALTVDANDFIYVMDYSRSRIYMYDQECRLITAFANGLEAGTQVGTFVTPTALTATEDELYVLDKIRNVVTVFRLTEYGKLVKQADTLTMDGEYLEALPLWEQVLKLDGNNQRAYEGVARAMLAIANTEQDENGMGAAREYYNKAMEYAELGNDQEIYSQAFEEIQKDWISRNFWWLFILCLAAVGGIAALLVLSKKRKIFEIKNVKVKTALTVPIHPFQAFQALKYQQTGSVPLACLFVVLFYLASVSEDLYGGFMYVITDTANYNALYSMIGTVGVLLLWVIVNWGLCILLEGKGSLKEVFIMSSYCLSPMILYSVIFTVASHLIPATSTSTFALLGTIVAIYMVLLMLIGITVVHEYSFFKAMGTALLSLFGMVLAAFVIFSVILLAQQFILFFVGLISEAMLR